MGRSGVTTVVPWFLTIGGAMVTAPDRSRSAADGGVLVCAVTAVVALSASANKVSRSRVGFIGSSSHVGCVLGQDRADTAAARSASCRVGQPRRLSFPRQ